MTPIKKNILVVDENGEVYEATYPKRAKGLVKNGRARFVSENKICLACPPNNDLEDSEMSDKMETIIHDINTQNTEKLSVSYVLEQIEKITLQTEYLNNAIQKLGEVADYGEDLIGQAKAQALGDIVRCKETTNQQVLKFYEKMYDDLKTKSS